MLNFLCKLTVWFLLLFSVHSFAVVDGQVSEEDRQELRGYFFTAARVGNIEVMSAFLEAGLSPDMRNPKSYTPLMLAAYNGQPEMVDFLLAQGANPCLQDKRGNTALMGAIFKIEISIARTLMRADCDLQTTNKQGQTANDIATLYNQNALKELLVKYDI
ncbi:ankyrin repeat domain-containing protein [Parendozoicomonas sp. Alg238-R29]|uniref:ankyrin repeat domain-containing protein n=1 Tax=Parendozoicomonas sp. Alg238-R29 TaxID=2993446 RepID=UPI00248F2DA1|nr:ankyrin repeat domain-containing protein [Parendozoicomonas sp. Alg238-R29]